MNTGVPGFFTADAPAVAVLCRHGFHVSCVRTVIGLGDSKRKKSVTGGQWFRPLGFLLVATVFEHQQQADVIGHDRVFILQVAMQTQALAGEVLANNGHAQVGAVATPEFLRKRVAKVTGRIGAATGLPEQCFPRLGRPTVVVPVGA